MISDRVLFCEGQEQSLDLRILSSLYGKKRIVVKPVGGKGSLSPYMDGYMQAGGGITYLAIRDRDFDREPVETNAEPGLIEFAERIVAWPRHEIENYLLEPALLAEVLNEARTWPRPIAIEPQQAATVRATLDGAAKRICFFEAGRWALGTLRHKLRASVHLPNRWGPKIPKLPDTRELTESECRRGVQLCVEDFHGAPLQIRPKDAIAQYDMYIKRFVEPTFLDEQRYLTWFSGKDLFASFLAEIGLLTPGYYVGLLNRTCDRFINSEALRPADFRVLEGEIERRMFTRK